MGFRNPITSASGVDTPTDLIRIYETSAPNGLGGTIQRGIIQLASGVNGEGGSTIEMDSFPDASNNSQGTTVVVHGSDVTHAGATTTAPRIELSTGPGASPASTTAWASVARLVASDAAVLNAPAVYTKPLYDYDSGRAIDRVMEIVEPAAGSYATGWGPLGSGSYQGLQFVRYRNGMISVSGVLKYLGGTGASLTMFALSGVYRPRNLQSHIVHGNVADTFRDVDVTATALLLRGALPTVGQFVSINGTYPGTLVT